MCFSGEGFLDRFCVIAHNVSSVYDVLPARIRALRSKDQGWHPFLQERHVPQ
jgi:hypothetical protein